MHEDTHTGVFTTFSAVIGGLSKVLIAKPLLLNVNLGGLATVATYAAASAVVGYFVKRGLDWATGAAMRHFNGEDQDE